jgi:hypothetical protein
MKAPTSHRQILVNKIMQIMPKYLWKLAILTEKMLLNIINTSRVFLCKTLTQKMWALPEINFVQFIH